MGFGLLVPALHRGIRLPTKSIHAANQWWDYGGKWASCPDARSPTHMANSDSVIQPILKTLKVFSCLCSWVRSGLSLLSSDKVAQPEVLCPLLNAWGRLCLSVFSTYCQNKKKGFGDKNCVLLPPALVQLP